MQIPDDRNWEGEYDEVGAEVEYPCTGPARVLVCTIVSSDRPAIKGEEEKASNKIQGDHGDECISHQAKVSICKESYIEQQERDLESP